MTVCRNNNLVHELQNNLKLRSFAKYLTLKLKNIIETEHEIRFIAHRHKNLFLFWSIEQIFITQLKLKIAIYCQIQLVIC
jgi:hypothetical protein